MSKINKLNPLAAAVGAVVVAGTLGTSPALADDAVFTSLDLHAGYMLAEGDKDAEGKCGEGKCGEGKCGEGKCGEGKDTEGKCGEGKCGGEA